MLASGTLVGAETLNETISDNGGFANKAVSQIVLSGAPPQATVTGVDIEYWIDHAWVSDVRAYATTQRDGLWYDYLYLWDRTGAGPGPIHEVETDLGHWNGLTPNGTWYLVAGDFAPGATGEIDGWRISVHWATIDPPPAITSGRVVWHAYTSYDALDGQIHVYDFASGVHYQRATTTIGAHVVHAHNPNLSADGRYVVFMGLPAGPAYGADWRQHLDVFAYDFASDQVTNISAALGLSDAGEIEEDAAVAPDGSKIVFKRDVADIWEADLFGGGGLRRVTTGAGEKSGPQYAPDGAHIVFWVGAGANAYLGGAPTQNAAPAAPTLVRNNAGVQDYFPSYWGADRILYASWRSSNERDDDVKVWNLATQSDAFAKFNSPQAEDSDPFAITPKLAGFSTTRDSGRWELWYGDPDSGAAASLQISIAGKHNLGAKYTTNIVALTPPSADFDGDLRVGGADFLAWQRGFGAGQPTGAHAAGDADFDRDVDARDWEIWRNQFGDAAALAGAVGARVARPSEQPTISPAELDAAFARADLPASIDERLTWTIERAEWLRRPRLRGARIAYRDSGR